MAADVHASLARAQTTPERASSDSGQPVHPGAADVERAVDLS